MRDKVNQRSFRKSRVVHKSQRNHMQYLIARRAFKAVKRLEKIEDNTSQILQILSKWDEEK